MLPQSLSLMRYFRFREPVLARNTECRTNLRERSTTYAAARATSGDRDVAICVTSGGFTDHTRCNPMSSLSMKRGARVVTVLCTVLINATISASAAGGRKPCSQETARQLAPQARSDALVASLPNGVDTSSASDPLRAGPDRSR